MSNKATHVGPHKYYRAIFRESRKEIFRCALPGCSHFVYEPLILNRISICPLCGKEYIITGATLRVKKFHCEDCTRGRKTKVSRVLAEEISQDFRELFDGNFNLGELDD